MWQRRLDLTDSVSLKDTPLSKCRLTILIVVVIAKILK